MNNCKSKYTITNIGEVDIDNLASIPDYFFAIREVEDKESGNILYTPVRVPGARVMPTGNLANVAAIDANNSAIVVPKGQVRAGYIDTQPGGDVMRYADSHHEAMFLMLGAYTEDRMLIQTTGFLNIPEGHTYLRGVQYYLGENGEPVTDQTITGQKLFRPLTDHIININGDF